MQPWLQPMQTMISSGAPAAALRTRSGSAISARVMPTASAPPPAISFSAARTSTICVVPMTGTSTAARTAASGPASASGRAGGGGTIQLEEGKYAEWPRTSEAKSTGAVRHSSPAIAAQASASSPSGASSSAESRTPTASSGPAPSRTAASTSRAKRSGSAYASVRVFEAGEKNCAIR